MLVIKASHDQTFHLASQSDFLGLTKVMVPLMTQLAPCDFNASASGITRSKYNVVPHFEYLDQRNVMESLMMLSVLCDTDTGVNDVTQPKSHVAPHFNCLHLGIQWCN